MTTRRDLDGWAQSLDVDNDDDAIARLERLAGTASQADTLVTEVCRVLGKLRSAEPIAGLQRAGSYLEEASESLADVTRGFYLHERGR